MGIHFHPYSQLAPIDMAVTYAGLPALWDESGLASSNQSIASHNKHPSTIYCLKEDDRQSMAERSCSLPFRSSSFTR